MHAHTYVKGGAGGAAAVLEVGVEGQRDAAVAAAANDQSFRVGRHEEAAILALMARELALQANPWVRLAVAAVYEKDKAFAAAEKSAPAMLVAGRPARRLWVKCKNKHNTPGRIPGR
jgi:hypothetical protein